MIMRRVIGRIRASWPHTCIILRGDGHFSNPELMRLCVNDGNMDFIFGLPSNKLLDRLGESLMQEAKTLHAYRQGQARGKAICNTRLFGEFKYAAGSWSRAFRVIHKAEVMDMGDNPRFIVTSLDLPSPEIAYTQLYCARSYSQI